MGRIFEAWLWASIDPQVYTWGLLTRLSLAFGIAQASLAQHSLVRQFDEGRISDAHLYKLLSSIWTIGEAYTCTNTPRFIFSNDLFLSDSNKIKITTLLFVSLKQMSYLRDIMKKTSNNQPIITRFSKSTLCLFVMIFCPSTQGWKHCQPLRIF